MTVLAFTPFMQPLPVWDQWYLTAVPLCVGVAIVYKSIRARSMRRVPKEVMWSTLLIFSGLVGAAVGLYAIVRFTEWMRS